MHNTHNCSSAAFNILITVGLSIVLSYQVLILDRRTLTRDTVIYSFSILLFIAFAWDGRLEWYEAFLLLLLYAVYMVCMKFNHYLMRILGSCQLEFGEYVTCELYHYTIHIL